MKELMTARRKSAMETWVTPIHVREVPDGLCPEPETLSECGALDGMPEPQKKREVIISQMCKSAMTSGQGRTKPWHITWPDEERWSNPLMGWSASADPMAGVDLSFDTKDQAIHFAEKRGWAYDVKADIERFDDWGQNTYAHNFLPKKYENILKRDKLKQTIFKRPQANASHYFRPLKYHGDDEVPQHGLNPDQPWKY